MGGREGGREEEMCERCWSSDARTGSLMQTQAHRLADTQAERDENNNSSESKSTHDSKSIHSYYT